MITTRVQMLSVKDTRLEHSTYGTLREIMLNNSASTLVSSELKPTEW